jgi:hypothetical protein
MWGTGLTHMTFNNKYYDFAKIWQLIDHIDWISSAWASERMPRSLLTSGTA